MIRRAQAGRGLFLIALLGVVCALALPASASASAAPIADVQAPILPVPSLAFVPPGFSVNARAAVQVAETSPALIALHRTHHPLQYRVYTWALQHYEIYFMFHGTALADVAVSKQGRLSAVYTGPLALGVYARGHYGQTFDLPEVWIGFGLMFLIPLIRLRGRRLLDLLDLGAVLGLGVSYALFDGGHLEPAVWMIYPPLLYLLARMLLRGGGRTTPRRLDVAMPIALLVIGLIVLEAARIAVSLMPPEPMDVGYASALGAYKILHGQSIYYSSLGHPDTYGPIAYLAYVPFAAIWPVTGWNFVPAAHAATITFDLGTVAGLLVLGRRLRGGRDGLRLGLALAWLWAACPFTVLGMVKNTNDGLVALFAVLMLIALSGPIKRGALLGLAAAAKFFPAILLGLLLTGRRDGERGEWRKVLAGFVVVVGLAVAMFQGPGGIREMYDHTIGFQLSRADVFSAWALHPGLAPVKLLVEAAVAGLAVGLVFFPRGRRSLSQVSALAAALVIGVQLPALHWFYLYIVWFLPFVLVAVVAGEPHAPAVAPELVAGDTRILDLDSEPEPVGAV